MNHGRTFAWMRSDETLRHVDTRYKAPAGTQLLQGTVVTIDEANPGYLRRAVAADIDTRPAGTIGVITQENSHLPFPFAAPRIDTSDFDYCMADTQSDLSYGEGTKAAYTNTSARTFPGAKSYAAVQRFDEGLAVLDRVTVNADGLIVKSTNGNGFGVVTAIGPSHDGLRLEVVFTK